METQREPAVAGSFYDNDATRLEHCVAEFLGEATDSQPARAIVAPHAGYQYSGAIAGRVYREIAVPESVIILCPNHTGLGTRLSLWARGSWAIPGGSVPIDDALAGALLERTRRCATPVQSDTRAHLREHSIEVQLPFLRARRRDVKIVPLCLARLNYAQCRDLGEAIAEVIGERRAQNQDVLVVASSDMSHQVTAETAHRLDHLALERVLALDPAGLLNVVTRNDISMCGVIPTTVALVAALKLGATTARVTAYGNSGETSGDFRRVVGYAAVVVH